MLDVKQAVAKAREMMADLFPAPELQLEEVIKEPNEWRITFSIPMRDGPSLLPRQHWRKYKMVRLGDEDGTFKGIEIRNVE